MDYIVKKEEKEFVVESYKERKEESEKLFLGYAARLVKIVRK